MILHGKGVSEGIAIGTVTLYNRKTITATHSQFTTAMKEVGRFHVARLKVKAQLNDMKTSAEAGGDEIHANILSSYITLLDDPEYIAYIGRNIKEKEMSAEDAVIYVRDSLGNMFTSMEDEYMQTRAADIVDVGNRIVAALMGKSIVAPMLSNRAILVAEDLTPSETIALDKDKILAIITKKGSSLSHTAILARSMGIPAIVGIDFPPECEGRRIIVDGFTGDIIISPDEETLFEYRAKQAKAFKEQESLSNMLDLPSVTSDGKHIALFANVGSIPEIENAIAKGAEGIGLLRTEFLYMDSDTYPSEDAQYEAYKKALEVLDGRKLTIRTLDLGADKKTPYLHMAQEANPALGMRAIRYCLTHTDLFKIQLRAIYRASACGDVSLLIPMITSLSEVHEIKRLIEEIKYELDERNEKYGNPELGIMIETPAAAMIADILAREVDYLSIGTNDLTQYMLAVDRMNTSLEYLCDYRHEAIMRLLRSVISEGHDNGCRICVCGELAADTSFTHELLQMGVDELSVVPSKIPSVKGSIRDMKFR